MASLDLAVIGNGSFGALLDEQGRVVWCCLPRFDGDPVFCRLLDGGEQPRAVEAESGIWTVSLEGQVRTERAYIPNTAILRTRLYDNAGNAVEMHDFAPRFSQLGRMYRPTLLVRRLRPLSGRPRIRIRLRPLFQYGARAPAITHGSNHVRYLHSTKTLRLTTNAPLTYVLDETNFILDDPISMFLGPDETLAAPIEETARRFQEQTASHWQSWVKRLALPFEWQDAVIRAAITLKMCQFEETGAIIAAMTTSIPEAAGSGRNWDYRFCWLRDSFFVIRALNSLSDVETMEHYLRYLMNIVARVDGEHLQPVFGIGLESALVEREIGTLAGYRGMGPVRAGNQACEHIQHDVYGNVVLAAAQSFFDDRLFHLGSRGDFDLLEKVGERAFALHDQPDAGMWELRTRARVHTSSSLMCWAACDRLARIAERLELPERARYWRGRADSIHGIICSRGWSGALNAFVESFEGAGLDAGLLLMAEVNFLSADDPRFKSTVQALEKVLRRGLHMFRYAAADDFGVPENAFNICTFWYIDALARVGRRDEAREIFESMLAARNSLGLLSEDTDPVTGELWGNFPQTYSLVGIINAAMRLSRRWEEVV